MLFWRIEWQIQEEFRSIMSFREFHNELSPNWSTTTKFEQTITDFLFWNVVAVWSMVTITTQFSGEMPRQDIISQIGMRRK